LSVSFVTQQDISVWFEIVLISWLMWIMSIILQLVSKIWSAKALVEQQAILAEVYCNKTKEYRENKYNKIVHCLNTLAIASFTLGASTFLLFVYIVLY
jgi:hypothetical protein